MKLDLSACLEVFDGPPRSEVGILSSALGEDLLLNLVLHHLNRHADGPAWKQIDAPRPVVAVGSRKAVLDGILSNGVDHFLVECKFWTTSSIDSRREITAAMDLTEWAYAQFHEDNPAWRRPLEISTFQEGWPPVAKLIGARNGQQDPPGTRRLLAVWRPMRACPPTADAPTYITDIDIRTDGTHLSGQPKLFSGSLYCRHLLAGGTTHVSLRDMPDVGRTTIMSAAQLASRVLAS